MAAFRRGRPHNRHGAHDSRQIRGWLLVLCPWALLNAAPAAEPDPDQLLLQTAQQVRQLSPADAARGFPVKLRGVVTFHEPDWYLTFVQDETAGVYVAARKHLHGSIPLSIGTLVEVEGITTPGKFAPWVDGHGGSNASIRVLGSAPVPMPKPLSCDPFQQPALHSQRIEVEGTVRAISRHRNRTALELDTSVGRIKVLVPELSQGTAAPAHIIGRRVRACGVFGSIFNQRRQLADMVLYVPSLAELETDEAEVTDPFTLPVQSVNTLLQFRHEEQDLRARVQGVVTFHQPGRGFYMRGDTGGLWVQTKQIDVLMPGTQIDVVGFPTAAEFNPVLEDALVKELGPGPAPAPVSLTAEQALDGAHHADLVSLEATLLDQHKSPEEDILTLRSDKIVWHARLAGSGTRRLSPALQTGSLLRVTGICLIRSRPVEVTSVAPLSFNLHLRSPADVSVLRPPSWWTLERVRHGLALTVAAVSLAVVWVAVLRRRVRSQTEIIRHQLERETIHEERARIARELHDTLQQELIGIGLQLDTAAAHMAARPEAARRSLDLARSMVRHSQDEARQSIWDLRSHALENAGLISALHELLPPLAIGSGAQVEIIAARRPAPLPRWFELNLLRIAQEAVINAQKHARAAKISVNLDYDQDAVRLRISDDGRGFNAGESISIQGGHFGLLGMRERAEKIGGRFEVHSRPGEGTVVCVAAPIPSPSTPALNPVLPS